MKMNILAVSIFISLATWGATSFADNPQVFLTIKAPPKDTWTPCAPRNTKNDGLKYPDGLFTNKQLKTTKGGSTIIWNVLEDGTVTFFTSVDEANKTVQTFVSTTEKGCLDFQNISNSMNSSGLDHIESIVNIGTSKGHKVNLQDPFSRYNTASVLYSLHNNTVKLKSNTGESYYLDTRISDNSKYIYFTLFDNKSCIATEVASLDNFMNHNYNAFLDNRLFEQSGYNDIDRYGLFYDYEISQEGFVDQYLQEWGKKDVKGEISRNCGQTVTRADALESDQPTIECNEFLYELFSDSLLGYYDVRNYKKIIIASDAWPIVQDVFAPGEHGVAIGLLTPKQHGKQKKISFEYFPIVGGRKAAPPIFNKVDGEIPPNPGCENKFKESLKTRISAFNNLPAIEKNLLAKKEELKKQSAMESQKRYRNYLDNIDVVSKVLNYSEDGNEFGSEYGYWYPLDKKGCVYAKKDSSGHDIKMIDLNKVDPRGVKIGLGKDIMNKGGYIIRLGDVYEFFCAHEFITQAPKCEVDRLTRGWNRVYNEFCKGLEKDF